MAVGDLAEYHTIAYCHLFRVMKSGDAVRSVMEYSVKNHPYVKALEAEIAALKKPK